MKGSDLDYLIVDWEQMYKICIKLAEKIKKNRFNPDLIIGVARGGWIPARIMSDLLQNPKLVSIRVEFYKDVGKTGKKPKITQPLSVSVEKLKVLVIDDVVDTGQSLSVVTEFLSKKGADEIKTATLHYKPKSAFTPDFYVDKTSAWIVYPHERFEFIKSYIKNNIEKKCCFNDVLNEIHKSGLRQSYVRLLARDAWNETILEKELK